MKKILFYVTGGMLLGSILLSCNKDDGPAAVDCTTSGLSLTGTATNASCGNANGAISLSGTGGKGPYQYSINSTTFQTSTDFANLAAGDYTLTVKDANNCTNTATVKVNADAAVTIASTTAMAAGCGESNGGLNVVASGGVAPLQYSLDGTTFSTVANFINLTAGSYNVTVKDAAGCTTTANAVKVGVNPNSISYATNVETIITTNCAIGSCHVAGGNAPGNFSQFANIQAKASQIKTRTGNKSMPIGRTLTDEQIQQIACWVDAGAPNN